MSGGNISDGPKNASGNGTAPKDVGGYDAKAHQSKRVQYLEKQVERQKDENNLLSERLRQFSKEAADKIQALREMFNEQTNDLILARMTADKYIEKCDSLKDRVAELEEQIEAD